MAEPVTTQDGPSVTAEPDEPATDTELDGDWVCPHCHRGRCHRCTTRECRCCAGAPDDPALRR